MSARKNKAPNRRAPSLTLKEAQVLITHDFDSTRMKRKAFAVGLACKFGKQDVVVKELGDDEVTVAMEIGGNQQTVKVKKKEVIQTVKLILNRL